MANSSHIDIDELNKYISQIIFNVNSQLQTCNATIEKYNLLCATYRGNSENFNINDFQTAIDQMKEEFSKTLNAVNIENSKVSETIIEISNCSNLSVNDEAQALLNEDSNSPKSDESASENTPENLEIDSTANIILQENNKSEDLIEAFVSDQNQLDTTLKPDSTPKSDIESSIFDEDEPIVHTDAMIAESAEECSTDEAKFDSNFLQNGQNIAAKIPSEKDSFNWILASIAGFDSNSSCYIVEDIESDEVTGTNQQYTVKKEDVRVLPNKSLKIEIEWPIGSRVLALFPDSSCFYEATVVLVPSKRKKTHQTDYLLEFDDDIVNDRQMQRNVSAYDVIEC